MSKSWNAEEISQWFQNDEGLYELARYVLRTSKNKQIAAQELTNLLKNELTPNGIKYTKSSIRYALRNF